MDPATIGMIASGAGEVLGLGLQGEYQDQAARKNKELAKYNQQLALEMWEKTNYSAQRKQMEKAGLNVGLMYKGAGQGGTTQGAGVAQGVETGKAGMGIQAGLQIATMQAEVKLMEAQAKKAEAEATKTAGADTDVAKASIEQLKASTKNEEALAAVNKWEAQMKEIEVGIKDITTNDAINQIRESNKILMETFERMNRENKLGDQTYNDAVKGIQNSVAESAARISAIKAGIDLTKAQTGQANKAVELMQGQIIKLYTDKTIAWETLNNEQRKQATAEKMAEIQQQLMEFTTSTPQQIKQWLGVATDLVTLGATAKTTNPIGFK